MAFMSIPHTNDFYGTDFYASLMQFYTCSDFLEHLLRHQCQ